MNPLSIKIAVPEYLKWVLTDEIVVEKFQKYCNDKKIGWANGNVKVDHLGKRYYFVTNISEKLILSWSDWKISNTNVYQHFTLPTDWDAFRKYLDEYIAFHSKPHPKVGEYWVSKNGYYKGKLLRRNSLDNGWVIKTENGREDSIGDNGFGRMFTEEEVRQYKNTQLLSEAEQRYPKGTRFISAYNNEFEGVSTGKAELYGENINIYINENQKISAYHNGRWAKVVEEPNIKQKLEEAEKKIDELKDALRGTTKYADTVLKTWLILEQNMGTVNTETKDLKVVVEKAEELLNNK